MIEIGKCSELVTPGHCKRMLGNDIRLTASKHPSTYYTAPVKKQKIKIYLTSRLLGVKSPVLLGTVNMTLRNARSGNVPDGVT